MTDNNHPYIQAIKVPLVADLVLSLTVLYDDNGTSICFETEDEQFGRITIQKNGWNQNLPWGNSTLSRSQRKLGRF